MADTLIREGVAYGGQPLSPVPQYWDGSTSYEKVQGVNGATRVILFNSAGETFINSAPGTVQMVTSAGATNLFSGSNPASVQLTSTSTVSFSGTNTVEVITSAGGSAYFSGTNPAYTTNSVINRQLIFSGTGTFSSGATATSDVTFTITGSITATFTTPNHEVVIVSDSPYDLTLDVYKAISAGATYYVETSVKSAIVSAAYSASETINGKAIQVTGLFDFDQGLKFILTVTAAFTATVTTNLLVKELDV